MSGYQQARDDAEADAQVDRADVTIVDVSHDTNLAIDPASSAFMFVALLRGTAMLEQGDHRMELGQSRAAVINRTGHHVRCKAGSKVLLVTLSRQRLQALMSVVHGGARRLSLSPFSTLPLRMLGG